MKTEKELEDILAKLMYEAGIDEYEAHGVVIKLDRKKYEEAMKDGKVTNT